MDDEGNELFANHSGPANWSSTDRTALRANLQESLKGAPTVDAVSGCFAGLLTAADAQEATAMLRELSKCPTASAHTDYAAALAASDEGTTCCVIAGTGSLVCSEFREELVKSGGGGPLIGDYGSAFAVGRDALAEFFYGADEPFVKLPKLMVEVFGSALESKVTSAVYGEPSPAKKVALLAPAVAQDAEAGSSEAKRIVEDQMAKLARITAKHLYRWHSGQGSWNISLSGGVWDIASIFERSFRATVLNATTGKTVSIERLHTPPVYGAVKLAKRLLA